MRPHTSDLVRVFGRIGLLSFGGPAAQIALMHTELVERRGWMDEDSFLRALSLCMLLPGPEAMQLATYAGWKLRGTPGGLLAGALFVLPGALVIAALVGLYVSFGDLPTVAGAFVGIKSAVIVIVLMALRSVSAKALKSRNAWMIAGLAFLGIFALGLPFPLIIGAAAFWGWATAPRVAETKIPTPPVQARPMRTVAIWGGLWLLPLLAVDLAGPELLADIGWFFARLAVVTFGGAYAVLAYMTQTVVSGYEWITTTQMIDALGLAETTPGPLILVTQFVAMLTGFQQGGAGLALAAGAVALWATFMPCFLWIFLASPYLERLAARPDLAAALSGVTAAVVGVILNLSVWFALHVWFSDLGTVMFGPISLTIPNPATLELRALALTGLAAVVMVGIGRGMTLTLALCASVSAIWSLVPG